MTPEEIQASNTYNGARFLSPPHGCGFPRETSMPESNHRGNYDHVRCKTCGVAWDPGINKLTGEMESGHNVTAYCNRYRPTAAAPDWVAEALARHGRARDALCAAAVNSTADGQPKREVQSDG